ncbi:ZrgA family zinc uptake protein [Pelagibacterium xiamenense]|uniref:ZrgA family zinc uptake protein n=1 Tax=Pelagibacterium xiamenense TaxID=2901140 RepID=UPI001E63C863|nr:DUF2796 domain-containing protein [Pelagibacterium xiamenense]MCD7061027.1 DUF2796 domain-containing protein [Pelagibacterium xiamenense]
MRAIIFASPALLTGVAFAQDHRQLGSHIHGSGSLDIAIEGDHIALALEAPAFDVVGFETEATSEAQREAIDRAREYLSDPLDLWGITESAGCGVETNDVSLMQSHDSHSDSDDHAHDEEHDHGHEHEHEDDHDDDHDHVDEHEEAVHSSVAANVELHCEQIGNLTTLEPVYFEHFANAEELAVRIVSDSGQATVEISRDRPSISLP